MSDFCGKRPGNFPRGGIGKRKVSFWGEVFGLQHTEIWPPEVVLGRRKVTRKSKISPQKSPKIAPKWQFTMAPPCADGVNSTAAGNWGWERKRSRPVRFHTGETRTNGRRRALARWRRDKLEPVLLLGDLLLGFTTLTTLTTLTTQLVPSSRLHSLYPSRQSDLPERQVFQDVFNVLTTFYFHVDAKSVC